MPDAAFFTHPKLEWQRRYEALRASFVDRLPAKVVADRFGYSAAYIRLLRHQFQQGKLDFSELLPEGKTKRRRISAAIRGKIIAWRHQQLSAGDITQLLSEEGVEISVRTIERVLAEEGFSKLPRRTRLKLGQTVKCAQVPARTQAIALGDVEGSRWDCPTAGVFLFAPFLAQLNIEKVVRSAALPGTKPIPSLQYLLSFLVLKLLGTERYAHVGEQAFDPCIGLFAGLNVLPKCTALSTYAYSLDEFHLSRLQRAFVREGERLGLYDGSIINLDFHIIPHFGEESVLEQHDWIGHAVHSKK